MDALSVVTSIPGQRMEPPASLTAAQADVWRAVAATKPPEWFAADSEAVLVSYCQAVESLRHLSRYVEKYERRKHLKPEDMKSYLAALSARTKLTQSISMLATKMRLLQQSRYTPQSASTADRKTPNAERKPWDFGKSA